MSKIGKINISIPEKVNVALNGSVLNVDGPLGKKALNIDTNLFHDYNNITRYTSYYSDYKDTFESLSIKLNSMTFLEDKPADYFRILQ